MSFNVIKLDSHRVFLYFMDCSEREIEVVGESNRRIKGGKFDPVAHSFDQGFVIAVIVHDGDRCGGLCC